MTVKMETKKKMEIKNGDRDKGTPKPIKYMHWKKEKVNNEAWFKAKIEGPGRHKAIDMYGYNNCHTYMQLMHVCFFFFLPPNVCIQTAGPSLTCGLGADCCTINPTIEHRTQLWHA